MDPLQANLVKQRIVELQLEHRGLDSVLHTTPVEVRLDDLEVRRLKKRKLQIKDMITSLQMQLVPDIRA